MNGASERDPKGCTGSPVADPSNGGHKDQAQS